jgi:hypothetical protein
MYQIFVYSAACNTCYFGGGAVRPDLISSVNWRAPQVVIRLGYNHKNHYRFKSASLILESFLSLKYGT